jgi:hypothetical protein
LRIEDCNLLHWIVAYLLAAAATLVDCAEPKPAGPSAEQFATFVQEFERQQTKAAPEDFYSRQLAAAFGEHLGELHQKAARVGI